jgi:acyl-CoA dehydrogenase
VDALLSEDHLAVRREIRHLIGDICTPSALREMDEAKSFPTLIWERLSKAGWCGISVPEEFGGSGADLLTLAIVVEEIARASLSLGLIYFTTQFSAVHMLKRYGSQAQRKEILPRIAVGDVRVSFGFTEPEGGTDFLRTCRTVATPELDGYSITGRKVFTTGLSYSHYVLILARTSPHDPARRTEGFGAFLVPVNTPGLSYRAIDTISVRASSTNEMVLEGVHAPNTAVVGDVGSAFRQLFSSLNEERILTAALALGNAQAAIDDTVRYTRERSAFGGSIGRFQAVQHPLARLACRLAGARAMTYGAARDLDVGRDVKVAAVMAKYEASEAGFEVAHHGMRAMGGYGMATEFPMQRYFRDSHAMINGPITNEMCLNIIAESFGMERSY